MNKNIQTIATIAGIATAVVALGLWSTIGWMTPEEHEKDISHIEDHAKATEEAVKDFRNLWQCDEDVEELADLLALDDATPLDAERIRRIRKRMDDRGCHKYDLE